jgi:serine/threonine protein kinase
VVTTVGAPAQHGDRARSSPPGCPDENRITALVQGCLDEDAVRELDEHVDRCRACATLLQELGALLAPQGAVEAGTRDVDAVLRAGRYLILGPLGEGAMGVVSLAFDTELQRRVALKVIHPERLRSMEDAEIHEHLRREAQRLARFSHPNVLAVYDVGVVEGVAYVTFEYVEGRNVRRWLDEERPDWRSIVEIFLQAGRGLAAVHEAGLIHRDVKPDNILVGRDGRVRLADFGLAEAVDRARSGAGVGTPAYMTLEQLTGAPIDARSDQFSFCVSLFEALFGARPYRADDVLTLMAAMTSGDVDVPRRSGVPRAVLRVVLRGIKPRAEDRFGSMGELLAALEGAARRPSGLRSRIAPVSVGLVLTLGALFAASSWSGGRDGATVDASTRASNPEVSDAPNGVMAPLQPTAAEPAVIQPVAAEPAVNADSAVLAVPTVTKARKAATAAPNEPKAPLPSNPTKRSSSRRVAPRPRGSATPPWVHVPEGEELKTLERLNQAADLRRQGRDAWSRGDWRTCVTAFDRARELDSRGFYIESLQIQCKAKLTGVKASGTPIDSPGVGSRRQ